MEFSEDFYELRRQMRRWDEQNVLDYAKEEAQAKGRATGFIKGFAEGRAIGIAKVNAEVAKNLRAKGYDLAMIAESTGLSIEEVASL